MPSGFRMIIKKIYKLYCTRIEISTVEGISFKNITIILSNYLLPDSERITSYVYIMNSVFSSNGSGKSFRGRKSKFGSFYCFNPVDPVEI